MQCVVSLHSVNMLVRVNPYFTYWSYGCLWSSFLLCFERLLLVSQCAQIRAVFNIISQLLTCGAWVAQLFVPGFIFVVQRCSFWTDWSVCEENVNARVEEGWSIFIWRCRFHTRGHMQHVFLYTLVCLLPLNTHRRKHAHSRCCKVMFLIKLQQLFLL